MIKIFRLEDPPIFNLVKFEGDYGQLICTCHKVKYEYAIKKNRKLVVAYYDDNYYVLKVKDYKSNKNFIPDDDTPDYICELIIQYSTKN